MRYYEFKTTLNEVDDETKKDRVIRALNKKRADDPIFDKTYKLIVGPMIGTRIENYLTNIGKNDPDVSVKVISMLIKLIPELGNTTEVKKFIEDWNKGKEFVNINELIPSSGMDGPKSILTTISEGIPEKLFLKLANYKAGKSDAGPYEAALAIMSGSITYAGEGGGDLIIDGQKIEIKSGGTGGGGGRIYNDRKKLNQSAITQALSGTALESIASISVLSASGQGKGQDWTEFAQKEPETFKAIAKAINQVWFDGARTEIERAFGTPEFRLLWNRALFDDYANAAGHNGVLIIGQTQYQYIVSGDQLHSVPQSSKGSVYYPASRQDRELGIQVRLS
jgi:hypothetical protein